MMSVTNCNALSECVCVCVQGDVSDFILNAAGLLPAGVDWDGSMCDVMSVTGVVSVHGDCGLSWAVWSVE